MRKLLAALALALGMSLAQSYYVGGHVGIFGAFTIFSSTDERSFNGGIHVGAALGKDLPEVRLGVDFVRVLGVPITVISADALLPLSLPGSQVQLYVGAGGKVGLLSGDTYFGFNPTFGVRMVIPGAPLTGFMEVQPGYAFGNGNVLRAKQAFFYYVKLGVNYDF
jgi:hypothetical protein